MLYPSLESLLKVVGNRYLLVNITAHRAREIAEQANEAGIKLDNKPVKLAVEQILKQGVEGLTTESAKA